MADLGMIINRSELPEEENSFEPLPPAWYPVQVTNADVRDTKAGNGQYIKLEYTVVGDNFQGRKIFGMINIVNPNEVAENIGRKQLNQLMAAVGIETLKDTDELIGKTLEVKLAIKPATEQFDASNDVKAFKAGDKKAEPVAAGGGERPPWAQ